MKKLTVLLTTMLIVSLSQVQLQAQNNVYLEVTEKPAFPGGQEAYNKFLLSNLKYPARAREMGIEGIVDISFIVGTDGALSDFKVIRTAGGDCDKETLRVYKVSPKWTPGKKDGKVVRTRIQARVSFKIPEKDDSPDKKEGK